MIKKIKTKIKKMNRNIKVIDNSKQDQYRLNDDMMITTRNQGLQLKRGNFGRKTFMIMED